MRGLQVRGWPSTENGLELLLEELLFEGLMFEGLMFEELMMLEGGSRVTRTSPDLSKQLPNRKVNFVMHF